MKDASPLRPGRRVGAYIDAARRPCRLPPSSFCTRGVRGEHRHSQACENSTRHKALAVAPDYSGVRSRAATSASTSSRLANTGVFDSLRLLTEPPVQGTLRTPQRRAKLSGFALARLQSSATASWAETVLTAVRYGVGRCGRLSRW